MTNSEAPPPAPFTFKAAQQKPSKVAVTAAEQVAAVEEQNRSRPRRARNAPTPIELERKPRKRRAKSPTDALVLKACLRQLRKVNGDDALRIVETLRVLFK